MSNVVGIDFSSHFIDLVKLDEDLTAAHWTQVKLDGGTAWDRTRHLAPRMPTASWWDDVYLVAIEKPQSAGFKPATVLHRVQGVVIATIPQGVHAWEVTPAEWKRPLNLRPAAKPALEDISSFAPQLVSTGSKWSEWTQDALDALGVALYAHAENARGIAA